MAKPKKDVVKEVVVEEVEPVEFDLDEVFTIYETPAEQPQQLRRAAGMVKDYFRDQHKVGGAVTVNIRNGEVEEIVEVDIVSLDGGVLAHTLTDGKDIASEEVVKSSSGGLDPAKAKPAEHPFPKNNGQQ